MTPRLLLSGALTPGYRALDAQSAHYLSTVLRLRSGAEVEVFNGAGQRCLADIVPASTSEPTTPEPNRGRRARTRGRSQREQLALLLREPVTETPPPRPRILVGFGLLKGPATDEVLRKATELGATDLLPLITERTQQGRPLDDARRSSHWTGIIAAAAAQCQQDHLPALHAPLGFDQLFADGALPFPLATAQKLLLEPTGGAWPTDLPRADTALLLGPEGGWSGVELASAEAAGWRCTRMGTLVLRAETAPLAALSWLAATWEITR